MPRVVHTRLLFWAQGMAVTQQLILIRTARRGDQALLAHEEVHCAQMRRAGGALVFWWRWLSSRTWRALYEAQAYRAGLAIRPDNLERYADSLVRNYALRLTLDEARTLLNEGTPP